MGDVMLFGVLEMPYDMAMSDEIGRYQYHASGHQAARRIRADAAALAEAKATIARLEADAIQAIEFRLRSLFNGKYSSLTVGFNDSHAPNYATAQEFHDEWGHYGGDADHDMIEWASEEERQKALRENSVWTVQWYPDTPVGFYCVGASTLEAAIRAALSPGKGE